MNNTTKYNFKPDPFIKANGINCTTKRKYSDSASFVSKYLLRSNQNMIGQFVLGKTLGRGTFGKVKIGTHYITGEKVAIKILEKAKIKDDNDKTRVDREIKILKATFHYNIIRLYSVIETEHCMYLLMEYAEKGDLFNYIVRKKKLEENEACKYLHQLLDSVDYLHKIGVSHRDLKPENMLLDYNKDLKLADFGLSNLYKKGDFLLTGCGSPGYAPPEMVKGEKYDGLATDIWSCGVILFAMVCGYLPFDDPDEEKIYQLILIGKYDLPTTISPHVKDLINRILVKDPKKRLTMTEIRSHPWYNINTIPKIEGLFISINPTPIDLDIIEQMTKYGYDKEEVKSMLIGNKHNNATTLYYLIIKKNRKKGVVSVSDMISKQFQNHIKARKNSIPECLLLTKVDSTIIKEMSNEVIGKTRINSHRIYSKKMGASHSVKLSARHYYHNTTTTSSNSHQHYYMHSATEVSDYNSNHNNHNNSCLNEKNNQWDHLEGIKEQNENGDICSNNIRPHMPRYKGLKALKFKGRKNESLMTKQLKSDYEKYIKNSKAKPPRNNFAKSIILQTSVSYCKNEKKRINKTFNIMEDNQTVISTHNAYTSRDNNTHNSTTRKTETNCTTTRTRIQCSQDKEKDKGKGHSRSISQNKSEQIQGKNIIDNNHSPIIKIIQRKQRFISQPKQRAYGNIFNHSAIKEPINITLLFTKKKKKLYHSFLSNKEHNLNTANLNTSITSSHKKKKYIHQTSLPNYDSSIPNKSRSIDTNHYQHHQHYQSAINQNISSAFKPDGKLSIKSGDLITLNMAKRHQYLMQNKQTKRINASHRAISEPKEQKYKHKYNTHSNQTIYVHKPIVTTNDYMSIYSSKDKKTIAHNSIGTIHNQQDIITITTATLNSRNKSNSRASEKNANNVNGKYINLIKNIQTNKKYGYAGKPPTIKIGGYAKANCYNQNLHTNNFLNPKGKNIHKPSSEKKNNAKTPIKSTYSTCSNSSLPVFTGVYDQNWTSMKEVDSLKNDLLVLCPQREISILSTSSDMKYLCSKNGIKFMVEFCRVKDYDKLILIKVSLVDGSKEEFSSIEDVVHSILIN